MAQFTYSDLIQWSKQLPEWQRDALRRVLDHGEVTGADIADLAELAKAPYTSGAGPTSKAVPASEHHARPSAAELPPVRLVAVRDIAHVNALGKGPVWFGPEGLTVVYGGNATGKSGIVRILKKACRATDPGGPIRPNVFEPEPSQPPTAIIDFRVGDDERSHAWVDGGTSEADLRTINVFDTHCAAVQIEKANFISYTPAILQVFRSLASVTDRVADKLRTEKLGLGEQPVTLNALQLASDTSAGKFASSLRPDSDPHELERLCTLSAEEKARLADLRRALADDPLRKAQAEEVRGRRIAELAALASDASRRLSDEACDTMARLRKQQEVARKAAEAARQVFAASSVLGGLGTDVWRSLWESARRYSETHAYSGEPFPVVREGAVCVLCQQPLTEAASKRLHSFEEFVKADVQRRADEAEADVAAAVLSVRSLSLPLSGRAALRDAGMSAGDTEYGEALRRFVVAAKLRRRHVLREVGGKPVGQRPALPPQPVLEILRSAIQDEVGRLRAASRTEDRLRMERDRTELEAREKLGTHLQTVRAEIERMRAIRKLDAAIADCKTHAITHQARQAASAIITDILRSNFATNLSVIGLSETPVEVKLGAGEHGKHPYEMKLLPRPEVPPVEVLSEGERTCVALAGLLAELETTGNLSGIVLDDPVSSLDHRYRKRVAERLVREAKGRQVIILTHDVVFLYLLRKYARDLNVQVTEVSLERGYKRDHGRATDGPPWVAMPVKQRIARLRDASQEARRELIGGDRQAYEQRASEIYKRLRQSWERAVEEVLLNGTVLRFGDAVQTQRLSKLTDISDSDIEIVTREMSRCSDFVHDEAGAVNAGIPEPDALDADIGRLDDWIRELRKNRGRN